LIHTWKTYASQIPFKAKTSKIAVAENEGSKVLLDRLVQTVCGDKRQCHLLWSVMVQAIAINAFLYVA